MKSPTTAFRVREQLSAFVETMFPHFFRPRRKFLWDMLYGAMASSDVLLSGVVRALCKDITPKKTEDRINRNLDAEGLAGEVARAVTESRSSFVSERTLVIVDPTEIRKYHAQEIELLMTVRDASRSRDGDYPSSCGAIRDAWSSPATTAARRRSRSRSASRAPAHRESILIYHIRWRIKETIHFVKRSYGLEHVRVLTFRKLENLVSLVIAIAYFTAAWLGHATQRRGGACS